jgi:hypothetical protein
MRSILLLIFSLILLVGCSSERAAAPPLQAAPEKDNFVPLQAGLAQQKESAPLPDDALIVDLIESAAFAAPFVALQVPAVDGYAAIALPAGSDTDDLVGRVTVSVNIAEAGTYNAWAHVYWQDGCGNYIGVQVRDTPSRTAQDQIFDTWHWVRIGAFDLPAGDIPVTIIEREDGIAIGHVLFTTVAAFKPKDAPDAKLPAFAFDGFTDSFDRSPGHGLDDWALGGEWKVEFSLDPNRIPNQYALLGSGVGYATIRDREWNGCRIAFSVRPFEPGECDVAMNNSGGIAHMINNV